MKQGTDKTIGLHVRAIRIARGWTQKRVAGELSVSQSFLCDVEHGRRGLSLERLHRVAIVLGVDVANFGALCSRCGQSISAKGEA